MFRLWDSATGNYIVSTTDLNAVIERLAQYAECQNISRFQAPYHSINPDLPSQSYLPKLDSTSPSFLTTFRGKISTFLLSSSLNSGLMTFGLWSTISPSTLDTSTLIFRFPLSTAPLFVLPAVTVEQPLVFALESGGVLGGLVDEEGEFRD
jgi:hypothetical protein